MFEIKSINYDEFEALRLINGETGEYLEILKDFGAGLNDLRLKNRRGELVSFIDGYRSQDEIIHDHYTAFKGSKLSPYPNRVFNGQYEFAEVKYQLPINEVEGHNSLHAFLHNKAFEVIDSNAAHESAVLTLGFAYKGTEQGFPFPYQISIKYQFDASGFSVTTALRNIGVTELPLGDGWHPYFKFDHVDEVRLCLGNLKRISSNFGNTIGGLHGFEHEQAIGAIRLDDCFEVNGDKHQITLVEGSTGFSFDIWQESATDQYKYLQIYTPDHRNSIAVEPVTCPPDGLNTKIGVIILQPEEFVEMSFGVNFHLEN